MPSADGCRLVGLALVVDDSSKGCNLAFRYPPAPPHKASSFHTLPAPLLAKLFRPKNALCNARLELVVDELRFVSHPVLVSTDAHETTMFNVIFALTDDGVWRADAGATTDERRRTRAQAFYTVAAQLANGLLHEELRVGFVSSEVRELLHVRDEVVQSARRAGTSSAANTGAGGTSSGASGPSAAGAAAAAAVGGAVSSNGAGGTVDGGGGSAGTAAGASGVHVYHPHPHQMPPPHHLRSEAGESGSGSSSVEVDMQTLTAVSLEKSVLANDLKRVFHGLAEAGAAHVVLNGWVKLSLTLTDAVTVQMASLRPYHTLLLLSDKSAILTQLPADHARQLRDLVEAVNPLKSFQDIALETSIPIHQVFRLSAHLVYWGHGRIVDAITLYNIYQVTASADLHVASPLAVEFRRKFAPYELGEVLSTFSGTRRIGEYMKTLSTAKKTEYVHMLIWLLQQRFVVQLHRYIYFMIPSDGDYAADLGAKRASSVGESSPVPIASSFRRRRVNSSMTNASVTGSVSVAQTPPAGPASLALPSPPVAPMCGRPTAEGHGGSTVPMAQATNVASQLLFTDQERAYLAKIAKPNPVFALFKRLCVYFHGEHHIEEIMWRENLSRGELRTVMSTYQDIVVCCLHE
ncbi:unnamed protein product [Hyaloperonospora brassicae]|uniref:GATOR1 complex protein NPRL3 C-terminal HTH domain-containing protein n=1 Tax=Hyaloperonospora brassicae TaxID=162125 RepID=A0AAV0TAT2_HYABA|nr:unnamed protein product [Hyaloperonospora brassicae]